MKDKHVKKFKEWLDGRKKRFGANTFTHKDILQVTNANCCYSVLRSLKRCYDLEYQDIRTEDSYYREYSYKEKQGV